MLGIKAPVHSVENTRRAIEAGKRFPTAVSLLDAVIDQFADAIAHMADQLGDELDAVEDHVMHEEPADERHRIGRVRLQAVRVHTRAGWIVLASDASHLYANMQEERPFPIVFEVSRMIEGYRRLRELAHAPELIVPGHDPLVMKRYPAASAELDGIAVRLDEPPKA